MATSAEAEGVKLPPDLKITKESLHEKLQSDAQLVILDCRTTNCYGDGHIRGAINLSIPSIMLRRFIMGKIELISTIKCETLKGKIAESYTRDLFIIYGDDMNDTENNTTNEILIAVVNRLTGDGCKVAYLEEGFPAFKSAYPDFCDTAQELTNPGSDPVAAPLMGLRSLRISTTPVPSYRNRHHFGSSCGSSAATSSTESSEGEDRCDAFGDDDHNYPVEIIKNLYLGNNINSEDGVALSRKGIKYVLNVTADLPNVFESNPEFKYMRIPIADHWTQNLTQYFQKAIAFIDEGRDASKGVLVHCLAGVSRSVTVTIAYLMFKLCLPLNEAFNLVRNKKCNIAPNFHFMEQLNCYEEELQLSGKIKSAGDAGFRFHTEYLRLREEEEHRHHRRCDRCKHHDCKCKRTTYLAPLPESTSQDSDMDKMTDSDQPKE